MRGQNLSAGKLNAIKQEDDRGTITIGSEQVAVEFAVTNPTPVGEEFQINTNLTNAKTDPAVASLTGGSFVIAWQSNGQDGSGYGIYGQRYNASGVKVALNSASTPPPQTTKNLQR